MPFVARVVEPRRLARAGAGAAGAATVPARVTEHELDGVANRTLGNALRQLASLLRHADDVFGELSTQLRAAAERAHCAGDKLRRLADRVASADPRTVRVPEGSLSDFALRKVHYTAPSALARDLFTPGSRPACVRALYEQAAHESRGAQGAVPREPGAQGAPRVSVTPVLGRAHRALLRKVPVDIETRTPASVQHLRRWTSREALGPVSAAPNASVTLGATSDGPLATPDEGGELDHRLPSPEDQLQAIRDKFPAQLVTIDTSGRMFARLSCSRRSLAERSAPERSAPERSAPTRTRRPRGKRRNTISGTDHRELTEAVAVAGEASAGVRGAHSSDTLKKTASEGKRGHLSSLRQWGRSRLRLVSRAPPPAPTSCSSSDTGPAATVRMRRATRREEPQSSSGNWSASSESGRASLVSDSTAPARSPAARHAAAPPSEGTPTPEPRADTERDETGSEFSCDAEGYYTSFHVDSGLKTLREEEPPAAPRAPHPPPPDTEYEVFGHGSTSTTASSCGTVCTVRGPAPPPPAPPPAPARSSSLHAQCALQLLLFARAGPAGAGAASPDSGHHTGSSPLEDGSRGRRSPSDCSEGSDLEGSDRLERLRTKTCITSARIPSMCVITPAASDDECVPPPAPPARPPLQPLASLMHKLRGRLSGRKPRPGDTTPDPGDYVTIADVRHEPATTSTDAEYVSLAELPSKRDEPRGARVTLDAHGRVVYSSDTLKRRRGAHTTFAPGPCVHEPPRATIVAPAGGPDLPPAGAHVRLHDAEGSPGSGASPPAPRFASSTPRAATPADTPAGPLLSPVRSSMTNEELYAAIHRSKKRLHIRDTPAPAPAAAPPPAATSPRRVETGYLGGPAPASSCADRRGPPPHTSRRDFKRLLLAHSGPSPPALRLSAVEQLRRSKQRSPSASPVPVRVHQLSASPPARRAGAVRRMPPARSPLLRDSIPEHDEHPAPPSHRARLQASRELFFSSAPGTRHPDVQVKALHLHGPASLETAL